MSKFFPYFREMTRRTSSHFFIIMSEVKFSRKYPLIKIIIFNLSVSLFLASATQAQSIFEHSEDSFLAGKTSEVSPQQKKNGKKYNGLAVLIESGLDQSPVIRGRLNLAEAARSGVDAAKWQFYPTPNATVQQAHASKNDPSYQGDDRVFTFGLIQPLWSGGRLTAGLTIAEGQLASSLIDLEDGRRQLALNIVNAYGDWVNASQKIKAYEENVSIHRKLIELIKRRVGAGLSPESDTLFADGRLEQSLSELMTAKTQQINAIARLNQLLAYSVSNEDMRRISNPALRYTVNAEDMLRLALERSPAILKAKAQISVAEGQLAQSKSSLYPSVSLNIQRQDGNFSTSNLTSAAQTRAFITIGTNFGAGLSNFSQISSAASTRDYAQASEEAAKQDVTMQIQSDIAVLKSALFRVQSTELSCQAAKSTSESWARQFFAGKKQWQDLLNSTRELSVCQATLADANTALLIVVWRLAVESMGLDASLDLAFDK